MANAIEVQSLSKTFGEVKALSQVTFSVPEGAIFGFLGPNGAGKTTVIRTLMDFIRPSSGRITIFGQDSHQASTHLKKMIGFLPSDMQLNLNWTVAEHLALARDMRGISGNFTALAKQFNLPFKNKVHTLSTGNKQKLSILLAFTGNPKMLIMDEPTRGLDPVLQNELYDLLEQFTHHGNTVFFSSHNLSEVQRICSAVVLIKNGKVVAEQGMDEIREANIHLVSAVSRKPLNQAELLRQGAQVDYFKTHHVSLKITGDINPVITYLSRQDLTDLTVTHATLEDIFLEKYKGER